MSTNLNFTMLARTEPWFDLPYVEIDIPKSFMGQWKQIDSDYSKGLQLPPHNNFIPTDFSLKCENPASGNGHAPAAKRQRNVSNGLLCQSLYKLYSLQMLRADRRARMLLDGCTGIAHCQRDQDMFAGCC